MFSSRNIDSVKNYHIPFHFLLVSFFTQQLLCEYFSPTGTLVWVVSQINCAMGLSGVLRRSSQRLSSMPAHIWFRHLSFILLALIRVPYVFIVGDSTLNNNKHCLFYIYLPMRAETTSSCWELSKAKLTLSGRYCQTFWPDIRKTKDKNEEKGRRIGA